MPVSTVSQSQNHTSHVRWILLVVMCILSFISYILRTNLSIVGDRVMHDLGLTQVQLGLILSAFAWGYAIFEFPGGIMGDVLGSRKSLMIVAIAWCILTALTAMIPGRSFASITTILVLFIVIRFLVGATQAPLFPVIGGTIGNWFPVSSWALPNGLVSTFLNLGAAAAAPLIVWLMNISGWRGSFFLTAPLGLLGAFVWWHYVRDYPSQHPAVSANEVALIDADRSPPLDARKQKGGWKDVLKNRQVFLLTISYFCMNYIFYLIFNWFFIYLVDVRHVSERQAGYLTASQYVVGSVGATLGGFFCDRLAKRLGPRWGYRMLPIPCLLLTTVFLVAGAVAQNPYVAVAFFAVCSGLTQLTDPIYWGAIVAVSGRHAASASGILNTGGNAVGGIGAILVPIIAKQFGWVAAISSGGLFTIVAALLWLLIRSDQTMQD